MAIRWSRQRNAGQGLVLNGSVGFVPVKRTAAGDLAEQTD